MINWIKKVLLGIGGDEYDQLKAQPSEEPINNKKAWDLPDFEAMSKLELDIWARNLDKPLKLDRRRKKETMIEEITKHLDEEY